MRSFSILFLLAVCISCDNTPKKVVTMKDDVVALADDRFAGRETGTEGEQMAADYIIQRMKDIGLLAKGSEAYSQKFNFKNSINPHEQVKVGDSLKGDGLLEGENLVGYIDNGAETTVVIGAHYDHLGMGGIGSLYREGEAIHNGADDNASGVAVMLDLAQKLNDDSEGNYALNNYIFIAFSGEEMGLLGSAYWVKNATVPIESVNYMINMDMVGRLNEENTIAVHGVGTSPIFKQTLYANNNLGFNLAEHDSGVGPSDHTSFYIADIPVLHFFTGQHEDYHKPSDDSEKLNYPGMQKISEYLMNIIEDLNNDGKLTFKKTKDESEEVPAFKVALGVVPDYLFTGEGMRIDGVSDHKPAQKAGLIKGDIVKKLDTMKVKDMMSYMRALSTFENGQQAKVTVERSGELLEVEVEF